MSKIIVLVKTDQNTIPYLGEQTNTVDALKAYISQITETNKKYTIFFVGSDNTSSPIFKFVSTKLVPDMFFQSSIEIQGTMNLKTLSEGDVIFEVTQRGIGKCVTVTSEISLNKDETHNYITQLNSILDSQQKIQGEDTLPLFMLDPEDYTFAQRGDNFQRRFNTFINRTRIPFFSNTYKELKSDWEKGVYAFFYFVLLGCIYFPFVIPIINQIREEREVPLKRVIKTPSYT